MVNERYENLGNPIEIKIKDNYYVVAFIKLINKETSEFMCNLHIRNKEAGMMVEIDKNPTIKSSPKEVKSNVHKNLLNLIKNGYFDDDVEHQEYLYECMEALYKLQKTIKSKKSE